MLITQTSESYENEIRNIQNLVRAQVEGIILSLSRETENFDHIFKLQKRGLHLVLFDRNSDQINSSKVLVDNVLAGMEATNHLIEAGAKRIAFLAGPARVNVSNQRIEGYLKALKDAGIPVSKELILHSDFDAESAKILTKKLMENSCPPDGLVVIADRLAIGAAFQFREMGLSIPEDIKIISFNNEPIAELFSPSISSVSQPLEKIGELAIQLLIEQIENPENFVQNRVEILPFELIQWASSINSKKL